MYRRALLGDFDRDILEYTSSLQEDKEIANAVIRVLIAHVKALISENLIPEDAAEKILNELGSLEKDSQVLFYLDAEDIHEAIEIYLGERLGKIAGYLPLGRSRNDHVAAALRLRTKEYLIEEMKLLLSLRTLLLSKAEEHIDVLMPSFTHLQPAQPITFGHYLCHLEEILRDYTTMIFSVLEVVDKSPLGAAAAGGTRVPLNREKIGREMFGGFIENTLAAVSSRDFLYLAGAVNASLSVSLSRIAEDMCIFATPQFDYLVIPEEHLATSSIMPHKKNPATMEIARAWAGECVGHLVSLLTIHKGLPTGYNLDMQQANSHALKIFKGTIKTLRIILDFFLKIKIKEDSLLRDIHRFPLLLTDLCEIASMKGGIPYREIHAKFAKIVGEYGDTSEIYSAVERDFGVNLDLNEAVDKPVRGSPSPAKLREYIACARRAVEEHHMLLENLEEGK